MGISALGLDRDLGFCEYIKDIGLMTKMNDNDDIFISALGLDRPRFFAKTSRTLRASAAMVMETMRTTTMTRVSQPQ